MALSRADAALGRLSGVGQLLSDPSILVKPYLAREAVASSRIEGTVASLSDYLQARASDEPSESEDINEVLNYQLALAQIDHAWGTGFGLGRCELGEGPVWSRCIEVVQVNLEDPA
jgi:Fic family protein